MFCSNPTSQKFTSSESRQQQIERMVTDYEQQISTLQQKLKETHNKLIIQLDICKQQELTIIDLTKKIVQMQQSSNPIYIGGSSRIFENDDHLVHNNDNDTFNNQFNSYATNSAKESSFQNSLAELQREQLAIYNASSHHNNNYQHHQRNLGGGGQFTLNNSKNISAAEYNSPNFVEHTTTDLIKADLQAMRNRLLKEITHHSKLKEQYFALKSTHQQQVQELTKQIADLQHDHQNLIRQFEYLSNSHRKHQQQQSSSTHSSSNANNKQYSSVQFNEMSEKCNEYERLYRKQMLLTQSQSHKLIELKSMLSAQKEKVKDLESELERFSNCIKSTSTADGGNNNNMNSRCKEDNNRDRDQLCGTIRKKSSVSVIGGALRQRQVEFSDNKRGVVTHSDRHFQVQEDTRFVKQRPVCAVENISLVTAVTKQKMDINSVNSHKSNSSDFNNKTSNINNKQNSLTLSKSSKGSVAKSKRKESARRQEYQSTKELIKKLEEAQMMTRMKKRVLE